MATIEFTLADDGGNPMAFRRIAESHGLTGVAPWSRPAEGALNVVISTHSGPRELRFSSDSPDLPGAPTRVSWAGALTDLGGKPKAVARVRRILGLQRDLTSFLGLADSDPDLAWVRADGAGCIARGDTAFEDVLRTILTTNCSWSMTIRMTQLLVGSLGSEARPGLEPHEGRAFPSPASVSELTEGDLKEKIRVGYRAGRIGELARLVVSGELDLEGLAESGPGELTDRDLTRRLQALPGVGPYAAAHIGLLIGRPSGVILDSWTRPKYARITGRKHVTDAEIRKRVNRYGPDAGLALWLILTRNWFEPGLPS
ncbi:MAG: hypothetical protein WCI34_00360 [Actinomycetes bacterium]